MGATRRSVGNSFVVTTMEDPISVVAQYAPNNNPSNSQIHTAFLAGDLFMRTRNTDESFSGNVDPNHPWNRIVGESGDETDYSFGISQHKTTTNASPAPSDILSWADAPMATTQAKPYLWARVQQKSWNESTQSYVVDSTRYIRLTGEGGEDYIIESTVGSVAIDSNQTTGTLSTTLSFYKKEGSQGREAYSCFCTIFRKKGSTYTVIKLYTTAGSAVTYTHTAGTSVPELTAANYDAIVVCIYNAASTSHSGYLAELEIPVRKNGDSAFTVDLDNEMTNVALEESSGELISDADVYFEVRAFIGTAPVIQNCTVTPTSSDPDMTVSYDSTTHKVRVQISAGTPLGDTTTITITVVHSSYGTRVLHAIIAGVKGGKNAILQEILPSLNEISFARQDNGTLSPASRSLSLSFKKTEGGETTIQTINDSGLTVKWSDSSMPSTAESGNNWGNGTPTGISWNNITMNIANSVSASNIYIAAFKLVGVNIYVLVDRETVPIIKDGKHGANAPYVELSRSTILYDATNGGASSSSQDFAITYSLKVNGVALTIGGVNDISINLPTNVTIKSNTKTTSGVTFNIASGVSPSGVITITMTATDTNGISYTASESITVEANKEGNDAEFYKIDTDIDSVVIPSDQSSITLSTAPKAYFKKVKGNTESAQAMSARTYWRSGSSYSAMPAEIGVTNITLPIQYSSSYDALVIFCRASGQVSYSSYDAKKEVLIIKSGNTGQSGARGKIGRAYYYATEWNPNDNTKSFLVDDTQAPYFSNAGSNLNKYYAYNAETNGYYTMSQMAAATTVSGSIDWDNEPWSLMTDDFKYIITEALFTKFAKLGSAIFNEDFMYSKYLNNELSMYYSYNGQSISESNYALVLSQTSLPVIEGKQYKISITCYHNSGYSDGLFSRVYYNTKEDWSGTISSSTAFFGTSNNSEATYDIDFIAVQTGYVRIYNVGYGTVKKIAASQSESYEKVSPMFVNTDKVPLLPIGQVDTNKTFSEKEDIVDVPIPVVYGRRYDITFDSKISSGKGYVGLYSETGSSIGSIEISYSSLNPDFSTHILTIDPCGYTGNAYLKFYVGDPSCTLIVNSVYIQCPNAFVPQAIVDWLTGYAHFSGDRVRFNPDGSGHLAGGNITWDNESNTNIEGTIKAKNIYSPTTRITTSGTHVINPLSGDVGSYSIVSPTATATVMELPSAADYNGLELKFFAEQAIRQAYNTARIYSSTGIWYKDVNGFLDIANTLQLPANQILIVKSMTTGYGYAWYVIQGDATIIS